MKRWIIALALLCAVGPAAAFWQSRDSNYNQNVVSGGFTPSCTESSNWLARATGVTLTADKTNYDTLICGMVTDGTWAKMDAVYIFAAPDSTTAKLNLVQATFNGSTSLSFTAYTGFTGDGTNPFLTSLTPNAGGTQYTQNSASFGIYNRTANATENLIGLGTFNTVNASILLQAQFGVVACVVNGGSSVSVGIANTQGFWQCTRTASNSVGISKNGAATTTGASTSSGLDNSSITGFCQHQGGTTYASCVTDQLSAAYIGGALTDTDIANVSSRINTYMTAYSINVY